jgi:hypothetical protein
MWYWIYLLFSYYKSCVETATSSVHVEEELKPVSATACQQPIAFASTPDPVRPEFVSACGVSDIFSGGERGLWVFFVCICGMVFCSE